jgi:predicted lactoylglutathione lyase/ribosomal protein S18 acetylase RimI-like enzyme
MKQVFINLPVKDAVKSMDFYAQMGFSNNPLLTDENQKCMVWSEHIYVMLITNEQFTNWSTKSIPERNFTTATFTLPVESTERMNQIVEAGVKAGGQEPNPMLDEGFMQLKSIEDLDGHIWGVICLDVEKFKKRKEHNPSEINLLTAQAATKEDFELAKKLMKAYAADIGVDLAFQDFDSELKNVSMLYANPEGAFFIAYQNNKPVGCFGIKRVDGEICELKRMYLKKGSRGLGLGEKLVKEAIHIASMLKYERMRLDTLPSMHAAIHLYQKLGFKEIQPYRFNPIEGSKFMEVELPPAIQKTKSTAR